VTHLCEKCMHGFVGNPERKQTLRTRKPRRSVVMLMSLNNDGGLNGFIWLRYEPRMDFLWIRSSRALFIKTNFTCNICLLCILNHTIIVTPDHFGTHWCHSQGFQSQSSFFRIHHVNNTKLIEALTDHLYMNVLHKANMLFLKQNEFLRTYIYVHGSNRMIQIEST
jgi:hypothetical protein